ncbi:cation:proton antiporter, partial [Microbacterium lacticum]|uniref:cation:proton antiporter domain-containing protein n=1 Tax=Microbacterium lacticum TaxID=33885 RepID=UPI0037C9DB43
MLGALTVVVVLDGFDPRLLLVALLALTVFRVVPVYVSMLGSSVSWRDRTALGFIGPRGTATIV